VPPARSIRVGADVSITTTVIIGSSHFSVLRARFVFMFEPNMNLNTNREA